MNLSNKLTCLWEVEQVSVGMTFKALQMLRIMSFFLNSFFSDFFDHPCLLIRLFVLFTSRAKYHKLKYGTELNQGDMKPPSYDSGKCPVAQTGNSTSYLILNHCDCGVHMPQGTGLVCMWRLHSCWILFASIAFFCVSFSVWWKRGIVTDVLKKILSNLKSQWITKLIRLL